MSGATTPEIINDLRAQARYYHKGHDANLSRSLRRAAACLEDLAAENKALRDEIDAISTQFRELDLQACADADAAEVERHGAEVLSPIPTNRQNPMVRG